MESFSHLFQTKKKKKKEKKFARSEMNLQGFFFS